MVVASVEVVVACVVVVEAVVGSVVVAPVVDIVVSTNVVGKKLGSVMGMLHVETPEKDVWDVVPRSHAISTETGGSSASWATS